MLRYAIKKFYDYYLAKIDRNAEIEATSLLNYELIKIYENMDYYDRYHCIEVYKKLKIKTNNIDYLKLAIIHDCGKYRIGFIKRVFHKLGFKTILRQHTIMGYNKIRDIDYNLAKLVLYHHSNLNDIDMLKFQKADEES